MGSECCHSSKLPALWGYGLQSATHVACSEVSLLSPVAPQWFREAFAMPTEKVRVKTPITAIGSEGRMDVDFKGSC